MPIASAGATDSFARCITEAFFETARNINQAPMGPSMARLAQPGRGMSIPFACLMTLPTALPPTDPENGLDDAPDATPEAELRAFAIDAAHHGERLDRALAALAPEFSRSYLQQLIEAGAVTMNGTAATRSSQKVKAGERGTIELRPTPQSQAFRPEPMALDVVYEDEHLLV